MGQRKPLPEDIIPQCSQKIKCIFAVWQLRPRFTCLDFQKRKCSQINRLDAYNLTTHSDVFIIILSLRNAELAAKLLNRRRIADEKYKPPRRTMTTRFPIEDK